MDRDYIRDKELTRGNFTFTGVVSLAVFEVELRARLVVIGFAFKFPCGGAAAPCGGDVGKQSSHLSGQHRRSSCSANVDDCSYADITVAH